MPISAIRLGGTMGSCTRFPGYRPRTDLRLYHPRRSRSWPRCARIDPADLLPFRYAPDRRHPDHRLRMQAAAIFYTLIGSAMMLGIHSYYYLLDLTKRVYQRGLTAVDLIPGSWKSLYYNLRSAHPPLIIPEFPLVPS